MVIKDRSVAGSILEDPPLNEWGLFTTVKSKYPHQELVTETKLVPFRDSELKALKRAFEIRESFAPGPNEDNLMMFVYANTRLPWDEGLRKRLSALKQINRAANFLESYFKTHAASFFVGGHLLDLMRYTQLQDSLEQFRDPSFKTSSFLDR